MWIGIETFTERQPTEVMFWAKSQEHQIFIPHTTKKNTVFVQCVTVSNLHLCAQYKHKVIHLVATSVVSLFAGDG